MAGAFRLITGTDPAEVRVNVYICGSTKPAPALLPVWQFLYEKPENEYEEN
jgi:hypothetical protein